MINISLKAIFKCIFCLKTETKRSRIRKIAFSGATLPGCIWIWFAWRASVRVQWQYTRFRSTASSFEFCRRLCGGGQRAITFQSHRRYRYAVSNLFFRSRDFLCWTSYHKSNTYAANILSLRTEQRLI